MSGNLPLDKCCEVCDEPAGHGPGLRDLRCIWCQVREVLLITVLSLCCQVSVHDECRSELGDKCDYGKHRALIVPPERVVARQGRTVSSPRRRIISHVLPPPEPGTPGAGDTPSPGAGTRPLIVVGNNKSGNSDCAAILAGFRRHLNPGQVVSLSENSMEDALEWCSLTHPRQCTVLACGGDGTVRYK